MHGKASSNHGISLRLRKLRFHRDKYTRRHNLTNILGLTFIFHIIVISSMQLLLHFHSILFCVSLESYKRTEPQIQAPWFTTQPITPHFPPDRRRISRDSSCKYTPQSPSTPSGREQHKIFPLPILALTSTSSFSYVSQLCASLQMLYVLHWFRVRFLSSFLLVIYCWSTFIHVVFKSWIYFVKCFSFFASLCQDFLGLLSWLACAYTDIRHYNTPLPLVHMFVLCGTLWKLWDIVLARVMNVFILPLEATTGFTKSHLSTCQKQNFMQGKDLKEIPILQLPHKFQVDFLSASNTVLKLLT